MDRRTGSGQGAGLGARLATIAGFVLLAPVGLLYLASGLVVPMPWLAGMWLVWVGAVAFAVVNRRRPWVVLGTPLAAVVVWFAVVSLGEALLGWTA